MLVKHLVLALAGVALAAALSVAVFFVSEAALGTGGSPLEPREPVLTQATIAEPELKSVISTERTETEVERVETGTGTTVDDRGRNRGRNRGRGGDDSSGSGSSGSGSSGSSGSGSDSSGSGSGDD